MKGIIFALGFVALYAVFSILSNLSEMIQGEAIDYPLVGDVHWYPQLKLAMLSDLRLDIYSCLMLGLLQVQFLHLRVDHNLFDLLPNLCS